MSGFGTISKKTVVLVLLLSAAILSLLPVRAAGYLRSIAQVVMLPLSDAGTYVGMTIRQRAGQLGTSSQR